METIESGTETAKTGNDRLIFCINLNSGNFRQEIRRSFPVTVVSIPDSVVPVSVLYRDPYRSG